MATLKTLLFLFIMCSLFLALFAPQKIEKEDRKKQNKKNQKKNNKRTKNSTQLQHVDYVCSIFLAVGNLLKVS